MMKARHWLLLPGLAFFAAILILYLVCVPSWWQALVNFERWGLLALLAAPVGLVWWFKVRKDRDVSPWLGLVYFAFVGGAVFLWEAYAIGLFPDRQDVVEGTTHFYGSLFRTLGSVLLIVMSFAGPGGLIRQRWFASAPRYLDILIGMMAWGLLLFILGWLELLHFETVMPLLLIGVALGWRRWLRMARTMGTWRVRLNVPSLLSITAILVLAALHAVTVIRPFPIGFDAATLYMNIPRLVADYGGLLGAQAPYYFGLIQSIGFIGFDHVPTALALGMVMGSLALIPVFFVTRNLAGATPAWLAVAVLYALPMVIWQSGSEIKTDLCLLFVVGCIAHLAIGQADRRWLLIGFAAGFALGVKLLAVFILPALLLVGMRRRWGAGGAISGTFVVVALAALLAGSGVGPVRMPVEFSFVLAGLAMVCGLVLLVRRLLAGTGLPKLRPAMLPALAVLALSAPWLGRNALITGSTNPLHWVQGMPGNEMTEASAMTNVWGLLGLQGLNPPEVERTGKEEEGRRYLGYESGAYPYVQLPLRLTFQQTVRSFGNEIGFVFFALLTLVPFATCGSNRRLLWGLFPLSALGLWLAAGVPMLDLDAVLPGFLHSLLQNPNPWVAAMLILITTFLLALFLRVHRAQEGPLADVALFGWGYGLCWWFVGGGIAWYALPALAMLLIVFAVRLGNTTGLRPVWYIAGGVAVLLAMFLRLHDVNPNNNRSHPLLYPLFVPYQSGLFDADRVKSEQWGGTFSSVIDTLNADMSARILRVGTPITFFVNESDRRLIEDSQLDLFNRLWQRNPGGNSVALRLRGMGVQYIIMTLNPGGMDQTPDSSLQAKVVDFQRFLTSTSAISLVATDRQVRFGNGQVRHALFGGEIVRPGSMALFRIKP